MISIPASLRRAAESATFLACVLAWLVAAELGATWLQVTSAARVLRAAGVCCVALICLVELGVIDLHGAPLSPEGAGAAASVAARSIIPLD